jgi:hypothetical protein
MSVGVTRLSKDVVHTRFKLSGHCRAVEVEESTGRMRKMNSWSCKKRLVSQWDCKNKSHTNSLCNLPDVLAIIDINEVVLGGLLLP